MKLNHVGKQLEHDNRRAIDLKRDCAVNAITKSSVRESLASCAGGSWPTSHDADHRRGDGDDQQNRHGDHPKPPWPGP